MKRTIDSKAIIAVLILNFITLKMMFLPSLCSAELGKNGFISVGFVMLLEIGVVAIMLKLLKDSNKTFFEQMQDMFGVVVAKIITTIFLIYFLINTFAITQSFFQFLGENLYSKITWIEYIVPIFLMVIFVSTTDIYNISSVIGCFVPFLIIGVAISIFLGGINCDYSNILPFFENGYKNGIKIFDFAYWFGDALILVLFFGKTKDKQNTKPIFITVCILSIIITFFFLVFYCTYETNSLNNKEAIVDILKILPQNSDIGNITWVVTILWEVMLMVYICLYAYASRVFLQHITKIKNNYIAIGIVLALVLTGLLIINFDMTKVISFFIGYAKYFALFVQYVLPIVFFLFSFKGKKQNKSVGIAYEKTTAK